MLFSLYLYCTRLVAYEGSSSDANIFGQSANIIREYILELLNLITQAEAEPSEDTTNDDQGNDQRHQGKKLENSQINGIENNVRTSSTSPPPSTPGKYPLKLHVEAEKRFYSLCSDGVPYKLVGDNTWVIHKFEDTLTLSPNTQHILAVANLPSPLSPANDEQHSDSTQHRIQTLPRLDTASTHSSTSIFPTGEINDQQPSTSRSALSAQNAAIQQSTNQNQAQPNYFSEDKIDVVGIYENNGYAPYYQYDRQQYNHAARSPRRFYGIVRKTPLQLAALREVFQNNPYPHRENLIV